MRYSKLTCFFLAGILAALLAGCFNPITDVPPPSGDSLTEQGAGIPDTGSFTVTITVNPVSGGVAGRAAAGLDGDAIPSGGVRNTYLLVALVTGTEEVAGSWEGNKVNVDDANAVVDVSLPPGAYDFLLLMGHRERNYVAEATSGGKCVYKAGAPTLLAAGLTPNQSITTTTTNITLEMKPVAVTAKFTSATLGSGNDHTANAPGVDDLEVAADWKLTWTLTSGTNDAPTGFDRLKSARTPSDRDPSYLFRGVSGRAWENGGSYTSFSSNPVFDYAAGTTTLDLGELPGGVPCAAWFNLEYAPFSLDKSKWDGETWVIRNGVNDLPQDGQTDFSLNNNKIQWNATKNGNGALSFTMPATVINDLNLKPYLTAPVTGGTPAGSVVGKEYIGTVEWPVTAGGGGPTILYSDLFKANTVYTAKVTLYSLTGYTFKGVGENTFTYGISGEDGTLSTTHEAGQAGHPLEVTITFPATVPLPTVTDLDLTLKVPKPVRGDAPAASPFFAAQYTGTVAWNTSFTADGNFKGGTVYTAAVTLTAAPGWSFAGIKATTDTSPYFTHSGATVSHNAGTPDGTLEVTITFPATVPDPVKPGVEVTW